MDPVLAIRAVHPDVASAIEGIEDIPAPMDVEPLGNKFATGAPEANAMHGGRTTVTQEELDKMITELAAAPAEAQSAAVEGEYDILSGMFGN